MLGFNRDPKHTVQPSTRPNRLWAVGAGLLLLTDIACGGGGSKPASRETLTAAVENPGVHFLPKGETCPKGGEPFEVPGMDDTYLILVDQENPADPNSLTYAVLAQKTYKDIGGVVCGPDGGPKFGNIGTRFNGNAIVAVSDSTMVVAVSLQK